MPQSATAPVLPSGESLLSALSDIAPMPVLTSGAGSQLVAMSFDGGGGNFSGGAQLVVAAQPGSQQVEAGQEMNVQLPSGIFQHSDSSARTQVEATMADGSPLPSWLRFDNTSGQFSGSPPPGSSGVLDIRVSARDDKGNSANTQFQLRVNETQAATGASTPSTGTSDTRVTQATSGTSSTSSATTGSTADSGAVPLFSPATSGLLVLGTVESGSGQSGLFLAVTPAETEALAGRPVSFQLPEGMFRHTDSNARVSIEARRVDGERLPEWLSFDPETGRFQGRPPENTSEVIEIRVTARDQNGKEVSTDFRIRVVELSQAEEANDTETQVERERSNPDPSARETQNLESDEPDVNKQARGRSSLAEQLARYGRFGNEQARQLMIQQLQRATAERHARQSA
jgi:hypothetical protein